MSDPLSLDEFYKVYKNEVQAIQPQLTDFSDGSINDIQAGGNSALAQEVQRVMLDKFKLTFLKGSEGQDLEDLAIDHYGDTFERPDATKSIGIVTFTRPNFAAGVVNIPVDTIVKSVPDANGETQRFSVILATTMGATSLSVNASIEAVEAGPKGDVDEDTITVIESALSDPTITVNNDEETSGGEPEQDDATYRDTILKLIQGLKGATKEAILATALNVPGVVTGTAQEFIQTVIEWDEATSTPVAGATPFKIARTKLYIADANGDASDALIANVKNALFFVRACGVFIDILGATALDFDWDATITLDVGGPNFATLSADPQPIIDTMTKFIQDLAIGGNFNRALARKAILDVWGPIADGGSGDLTQFLTNNPSGDVSVDEDEKLIPDSITLT